MKKNLRKSCRSRQADGISYSQLEDRRLLAVTASFDVPTGVLSIGFSQSGDAAVLDLVGNNIAVNGNTSIPSTSGNPIPAGDVLRLEVTGNIAANDQRLFLAGDFSASNGNLDSISIADISYVAFDGVYDLAGDLSISLADNGSTPPSGVVDTGSSSISVTGSTNLAVGSTDIQLTNPTHDFIGPVTITSADNISIVDQTDLLLAGLSATGDVTLQAIGDLTDTPTATISIGDVMDLTAENILLGESTTDSLSAFRTRLNAVGVAEVHQDSQIILIGTQSADSLILESTIAIYDSRTSDISVTNNALLIGQNRIRIGEHTTDFFNAGTLEFRSNGHVDIFEDSDTVIAGTNTATSLDIVSLGDLTDTATASINVTNVTGFQGTNIIIGDADTDAFNSGAIYFFTNGELLLNEDSGTHIIEGKNFADRMILRSKGFITDANNAAIDVTNAAGFIAEAVNLGDSDDDSFNAGSIFFQITDSFLISENSATNLAGNSLAASASITSTGSITNSEDANVDVTTVTRLIGNTINLGNSANDQLNFGSISFQSAGSTAISQDSSMLLTETNTATTATLDALGSLFDSSISQTAIAGILSLSGTNITMGDELSDQFNANGLTLNSSGDVVVTEDSTTILAGSTTARNLSITAAGNIADAETASIVVQEALSLAGQIINLGTEITDNVQFGTVEFTAANNVNIDANANINLAGANSTAGNLVLSSTGNISDDDNAELLVQGFAILNGVDIELGDSLTDCLDVMGDLTVNASGAEDVTLGCP